VVIVGMSDEDAIDAAEGMGKNLLSEVRTTVYEQPCALGLDENGAA